MAEKWHERATNAEAENKRLLERVRELERKPRGIDDLLDELAAANERIAELEARCQGLADEALVYQSMANRRGEIIAALDGETKG